MQPRAWLFLILFAIATCLAYARKIPDSAWQKGLLKDIQTEQASSYSGTLYQGNGTLRGGTYAIQHLIIETPEMEYEVVPLNGDTRSSLMRGRLDFTVNLTYEFAVQKSEMYIRDAHGKEGKFRIVKKTLKAPQGPN